MPNLPSTSLWDPVPALELLQHTLARTAHLLCCAQRWAGPNDSAGELRLLRHRLAPDMLALGHQVMVLADGTLGATALLAGVAHPATGKVFNRGEGHLTEGFPATLEEAQAMVRQARTALEPLCVQASRCPPDQRIVVSRPGHHRVFNARDFVWCYVVPNACFHLSMVHALLRAAGVDIGKADFEGEACYTLYDALPP